MINTFYDYENIEYDSCSIYGNHKCYDCGNESDDVMLYENMYHEQTHRHRDILLCETCHKEFQSVIKNSFRLDVDGFVQDILDKRFCAQVA